MLPWICSHGYSHILVGGNANWYNYFGKMDMCTALLAIVKRENDTNFFKH